MDIYNIGWFANTVTPVYLMHCSVLIEVLSILLFSKRCDFSKYKTVKLFILLKWLIQFKCANKFILCVFLFFRIPSKCRIFYRLQFKTKHGDLQIVKCLKGQYCVSFLHLFLNDLQCTIISVYLLNTHKKAILVAVVVQINIDLFRHFRSYSFCFNAN